jgi:hypothetical protein
VGLWSAGGGLWEVRCRGVLDQARALSAEGDEDSSMQGDALAALLCDAWGLPRASGRHAVSALMRLVGLDPSGGPPLGSDNDVNNTSSDSDGMDGNVTVAMARALLPHVRQ